MAKSKTDTQIPKFETLHHTALLLRTDQLDFLNVIQRETTTRRKGIGKHPDKETITKNTYIRALIDILQEKHKKLDLDNVLNEKDLKKRIKKIFK
jgi:hypothetical protein